MWGTLCLTFTDPEHSGYFKSNPFSPAITSGRNCSFSSNRRHWLCMLFFSSQIRTQLCSQQTVGGQGSQHSQCFREERDFLKLRGGPQSKFFLTFICLCRHLFGVKSLRHCRPRHFAVVVQLMAQKLSC